MGRINVKESWDPEHDVQRRTSCAKKNSADNLRLSHQTYGHRTASIFGNRVLRILGAQNEIAKNEKLMKG
jgi:hypothetical protein